MANGNNEKVWTMIARIGYAAVLLVLVALAFGSADTRLKALEKDNVSKEVINLKFEIIEKALKRNDVDHAAILIKLEQIRKAQENN